MSSDSGEGKSYLLVLFIVTFFHFIYLWPIFQWETLKVTMSHLIYASNTELRKELCKFSDELVISKVPIISPLGMFPFTRQQLVVVSDIIIQYIII